MEDNNSNFTSVQTSRRSFLKASATVAGIAGVLKVSGASGLLAVTEKPSKSTNNLPLKVAGYKLDRVDALIDGRVQIEGCDMQFEAASIGDINTNVFSGPQLYDVTEIGLHPYMLAYANDGFRGYSLLPIFPLRLFRHKSIFIRTDRGITKPEDLRGKKVATPGFSSTSLTWLRGIVQHEYGVKPEQIQWVISSKDSSAKAAGKVSKQESVIPKGLSIRNGPAGKDESDLLESGEVDALFHAAEPRAYVEGHPKVARLFPDFRKTEREYFAKTGIFPIMHAVAIRNDIIDQTPWLPKAVFNAYSQAKQLMYDHLKKMAWVTTSLPWIAQEIEETRTLMGENFWPYGIVPNRKALKTLFQYSYEQGLASRKLTIEELFHPSTMAFEDDQFRNLIGRWRRVDGGYIIDIRRIGANGRMDAAYYNPKSIHVSRAETSLKKGAPYIFMELQDVGYPGSTYTLMYRPQQDILAGFYFQAAVKQTFEVVFARVE